MRNIYRLSSIFCLALAGIISVYSQNSQWVPTNGPYGGFAPVVAVNAAGHVYAGAQYSGIFRSTNSGLSWTQINAAAPLTDIGAIAFGLTGEVYAAGYNRAIRSTDNGETWTSMNLPIPINDMVMSLTVNSAGYLLMGTEFNGIWRSSDKGDHWVRTDSTASFIWEMVNSQHVTLAKPYITFGVYRSTDDGATWHKSNNGLGKFATLVSIMPGTYSTVYAYTDSGLFVSDNNGASWQLFGPRFSQPGLRKMIYSPNNGFYALTDSGLFRSNTGALWTKISSGISDKDVRTIASFGTHVFLNTYYAGMFHSSDGGTTWQLSVDGFRATNIHSTVVTPGGRLLASGSGNTFISLDKGGHWGSLKLNLPYNEARQFLTGPGKVLYAVGYSDISKSTDDGSTWTELNVPFSLSYLYSAAITSSGTLFVGTLSTGVYRSTNGGNTWDPASTGLGLNQINSFAPIAGDTILCYSYNNGIYRTTNNGLNWTSFPAPQGTDLQMLYSTPNRTVFATSTYYIMRSNDGGNTWVTASAGLSGSQIMSFGYVAPSTLYTATYDYFVYRSLDNANSWQLVSKNPGTFANAFAQDADGVVYVGSALGVYRSTGQTYYRPSGLSTSDVPHDQGGKLSLEWNASVLDADLNSLIKYSIWRALPDSIGDPPLFSHPVTNSSGKTLAAQSASSGWEWLADVPAHRYSRYAYTAATLFDSMSGVSGTHYFRVSAHTSDANVFFDSAPIAGYSVDNLPPGPPQALALGITSGKVTLHWHPNAEHDLQGYLVYRLNSPAALSDTSKPIALLKDTSFIDQHPSAGTWYYAVVASDVHGNRSTPSIFLSAIITGADGSLTALPMEFALFNNYPNPFNPLTTIRYALPSASNVRLTIHDVLGNEIATLVDEEQPAGLKEVRWDGSSVSSGIYFYRVRAGSFVDIKKMLLLK